MYFGFVDKKKVLSNVITDIRYFNTLNLYVLKLVDFLFVHRLTVHRSILLFLAAKALSLPLT